MWIKLVILFSFLSCNKVYDLEKKSGLHFIKSAKTEVSTLKNIEWDIGKKREVTISKGLRFSSTIPSLSSESKEILKKKYGIDSWLIKISRFKRGHNQALGYFYFRLGNMTRSTKDFTVNLYYHAAAVSKSFRMFHCPAFGHRFELNSFKIITRSTPMKKDLFIRPVRRLRAKANRLKFAPIVVSGGRSLLGKYYVDLALYNSSSKQIYSNWLSSPAYINIAQEIKRAVSSCVGIKEENNPLPQSKMPSIKDLEIK